MNGCIIPGTLTPVEVLTVQTACCMAVSESGEPKRVLFFRRPEDPRETPIQSFTVRLYIVKNTAQ